MADSEETDLNALFAEIAAAPFKEINPLAPASPELQAELDRMIAEIKEVGDSPGPRALAPYEASAARRSLQFALHMIGDRQIEASDLIAKAIERLDRAIVEHD